MASKPGFPADAAAHLEPTIMTAAHAILEAAIEVGSVVCSGVIQGVL
jgi:hypothetical protein